MTEQQAIQAAIEQANRPRVAEDARPWWKRLVSSLRLVVKPGKNFKQPIKSVEVRGGVEF